MFKSGFALSTDAHLKAAMFNKTMITVWQNGHILDCNGLIESYTDNSVTINGGKYLKDTCEFKVR